MLRNVRDLIGMNRLRRGTTGAAPIAPEQIRWFQSLGVPLFEGYGMTETTGVASLNSAKREKVGTVGEALPGTDVRIADNGEVLVRGDHVFAGYWRNPKKPLKTSAMAGCIPAMWGDWKTACSPLPAASRTSLSPQGARTLRRQKLKAG